ncbi:MAG: DUF4369 domain-containing protein [Muribaculaceae bacterium]|nr:DUF4369 domain-containing protein [Muribaculaceae bacterium]
MKHLKNLLIISIVAIIATACGDNTQFRIAGQVDGLGTQNVHMIYVSSGALTRLTTTAVDGKFTFIGNSPEYSLVEILSSDKNVIGRVIIKNGQTVDAIFNIDDPYAIKLEGNKPCEQWSAFIRDNADIIKSGNTRKIDDAVETFVQSHKTDIVSSALMLTLFNATDNESRADSIFALISPEARPSSMTEGYRSQLADINIAALNAKIKSFSLYTAGDSIERYFPSKSSLSLFYFNGGISERRDTITSKILTLVDKYPRKRLRAVEVSFATDTVKWKYSIKDDSVTWPQTWCAGGAAHPTFDKLNIPRTPYFIVADSSGTQLYRGTSITNAIALIRQRLNANLKN